MITLRHSVAFPHDYGSLQVITLQLRSQCYALRPSCDRARNPTACVQSAILVPPSQEAFLSRSGIPDASFMQALRRTKLRNQCTAARTRCDRTRLPNTCSRSPYLALLLRSALPPPSDCQLPSKAGAAQNYATKATRCDRAATARALQSHLCD